MVQNRRRRTLNWALKGKQIFNNNRKNSLKIAYAKVQKHRTHKNGKNRVTLGQRIWPSTIEDDDGDSTCQLIEDLEYCGKDLTPTFLHPR